MQIAKGATSRYLLGGAVKGAFHLSLVLFINYMVWFYLIFAGLTAAKAPQILLVNSTLKTAAAQESF